ncbi:MAG: hypothetical protein IJK86_08535 [Lachnospiraceae bacterium]|nr:hypothetical protein [Lachnospiraceae bacterium]
MDDNKKIDLKKLGKSISEKARSGLETAKDVSVRAKDAVAASAGSFIQSIDQTGDGRFDREDLAEIKRQIQEKDRQAKLKRDLEALNPIFVKDLTDGDFFLSKMIRVAEMDKKHMASSACAGAIGHETLVKDLRIVTIYPDQSDVWGLQYYPDMNQDFYYVNPVDPSQYVAIDYFFDFLRQARVGELQRIAQDLGARFFKVTIKERKKTLYKKKVSEKLSVRSGLFNGKADADHSVSANDLSDGEIAAQSSFEGHAPVRPNLVYYKNEPQIQSLIEMRLGNTENNLTEQHLSLKCTHSSGITENVAARIDAAFSMMKVTGNTTFSSEAQNEVRQIFEYDIVF